LKSLWKKISFSIVILVFLFFTLGPILWCLIISISPGKELLNTSANFLPNTPTLENYRLLLDLRTVQSNAFIKGLKNSMKAVSMTLLIGLPISLMTAYALSRLKFKGREVVRVTLLITIVIPVFTTIIPLYAIFADLGILDNIFWLSVIYVSSFLPMITWVLSNYINTIPKELDEAAFLDGCGKVRTFLLIMIPNSLPIIFAVILMMFLMTWNQYQIPLILASSLDTKPLSMVAAEFSSKDTIRYGMIAAAGILALIPPAAVAVIFRKSLILGLTQGAIKG
jgi:multiple sugar transport system permease protein